MKVVVTEMPAYPHVCLFSRYDIEYDVCECVLSYNSGYECTNISACPYLKVLNEVK